ncbi:hypothetical protein E6O75_ATG03869 [Venturia nashicola]|uniref:DUF1264-domain-containing protein n=1 Tax=Venturia nashicola TaxID=86259 RepID=A0A4Z1PK49_9PEZI|nr:hypothetical protein E6O75_ATG03869 [Venturia nashicola]
MDSIPTTNDAKGEPISTKNTVLTTGASLIQDFKPVKHICAHLNAFHAYATDPSRCIETNHYCAHVNEDVRQCILYDSPDPNAKLIGIEYMITPRLYESLPTEERKLWHSHVFEVKSGMLIMPNPSPLPNAAWEQAEVAEMETVIGLYGKIFHLWQTDRGDTLPMGLPQLMTSFTSEEQMEGIGGFKKVVEERDKRLGGDWRRKREGRAYIEEPLVHGDADQTWKK